MKTETTTTDKGVVRVVKTDKTLTAKQAAELTCCDTMSKRGEVFTARRSFFYTSGKTAEDFAKKVIADIPGATMIDCGEVWKAFRGGASFAQQSHWWVTFTIKSVNTNEP